MSDKILSDLIGTRVRCELRKSWHDQYISTGDETVEGIVRLICPAPTELIVLIEDDHGKMHPRSLLANTITRVRLEDQLLKSDAFRKFTTSESFDENVRRSGGIPLSDQIDRLMAGLTDKEREILEKRFKDSPPTKLEFHAASNEVIAQEKASLRAIHMHDEWRPIYPGADVEQCTQCSYQRRRAGIGYQYRVDPGSDWFS